MGIKVPLVLAILAICTSGVVAPLPSLSEIFGAGISEETTPDPTTNELDSEKSLSAGVGGAAAGSVEFDKKLHLGDPKIASLDANLDIAAAKSAAFNKGINIESGQTTPSPPEVIVFPAAAPAVFQAPPPPRPVYVQVPAPRPPPPHYQNQQQQHVQHPYYNVHNQQVRPQNHY